MNIRTLVLLSILSLFFTHCGTPWKEGPAINVAFDTVRDDKVELLKGDLKILGGLPQGEGDTSKLEVSQFTGSGLNEWLAPRLKVIVGQEFDYVANIPEPDGSSSNKTLATFLRNSPTSDFFMMNLGAVLYSEGKRTSKTYAVKAGGQTFQATTPRIGIDLIGDALFNGSRSIKRTNLATPVNSLIRLTTLIHEARHTDGNGSNVTFPHTKCEDEQRELMCDASLNGPNAAAGAFLKYAYSFCDANDCTEAEKQGLLAVLADVKSRVRSDAKTNDVTPVSE